MLSNRVQRIKPSPTLGLSVRVNQLKAQGRDIINLGLGEPDFDTPQLIKEAGINAINEGYTKYTAVEGLLNLRKAVVEKFKCENHLVYTVDQILISLGSKQGIYNLAQAILNEGDEAIIPAPYWVSYLDIVLLAGGVPVAIPTDIKNHFKITPQQLSDAITPKTKLLILNSPNNPSGMMYSKQELMALGEVLKKHPSIVIASDDMYEHIQWTGENFCNILNACPALFSRTVIFNGVSKTYAMTGWRIGYCAGPKEIITAMTNIQSQSTSSANAMAQVAAENALQGSQDCVETMRRAYQKRHDFLVKAVNEIPGVNCLASSGSFYIFPDFSEFMTRHKNIKDDLALAEYFLMKANVAMIPGSAFGVPNCMRISFVVEIDKLGEAVERISSL